MIPTAAGFQRLLCAVMLCTGGGGCITITAVNIGQKTSLERQLIGELKPLNEEELLASSIRASGGAGAGSLDDLQQRAISARRRQLFNRDDIDEFKRAGCLGEDRDANLVERECDALTAEPDTELQDRVSQLLAEENVDRAAIIDWAVAVDPVLTPAQREQVVKVYARLLRERAVTGDWLRGDDGQWKQKDDS